MTAVGEANVYDSLGQAKLVEPKHILARYGSPEPAKSSSRALNELYLFFLCPRCGSVRYARED